jgi:predicted nucleic acid-binding protein
MEALAISAANLATIEQNLGAVANELSGVITNVSTVNNQVNKVESKVEDLNDEVKNLVKEIRETTVITNARQAIMYNNAQIEKKYGYYDNVRRTTSSFIDAIINSSVSKKALENLKQDLILNNPNYWLSNALAALASWMLDDKENTEKELNNALKKDSKKTSLFFCLINLKLGRTTTSINWLNKYLSEQNPTKLDKDFITVLDLISTGAFGDEAKEKSFIKIQTWFERLNSEKSIQDAQNTIWHDFIKSNQETDITMPKLEQYSKDTQKLKNNLAITSTYYNILNHLESIINTTQSNKQLDEIISDLIYEYETKEQIYQKDNLRNHLIIECNGNREEAERLYKKQESIYNDETDLLTLLSNIIIFKDSYKISNETQKISLSLMKNQILKSITELNKNIDNEEINIQIDNFYTKTIDGKNINETKKDLDNYLNTLFSEDDKDILLILIIINILGIIGIFITLKNQLLSTILIIILVISNIVFLFKLNQRTKYRTLAKTKEKAAKEAIIERILAEVIDYKNMMIEDQQHFSQLSTYLNNLNAKNYSKSNNERNINIGV